MVECSTITRIFWKGMTGNVRLTGKWHCGVLPVNRFSYEVELEGHNLDGETGFLTNNANIGAWFDSLHETSLSCEKLCSQAAMEFLALDSNITAARVRIWGITGKAYAEAECKRS